MVIGVENKTGNEYQRLYCFKTTLFDKKESILVFSRLPGSHKIRTNDETKYNASSVKQYKKKTFIVCSHTN